MALTLQRELNRLLDDFFSPSIPTLSLRTLRRGNEGDTSRESTAAWFPRIDVDENDKSVSVRADLPGVPKENVSIQINDNVLTISGENKEEKEYDESGARVRERRFGRFERRVVLPTDVNADAVDAKLDQGVLNVTISKSEKAAAKRITIQ